MPYTTLANKATPALIIYLLDISGSMSTVLGETTRIEVVMAALKSAIRRMVFRSTKGASVSPRYRIAIYAYSDQVHDIYGGVVPVTDAMRIGVPLLEPLRTTDTAAAFGRAAELLGAELPAIQDCPAPLICHMTDGEFTGEDPAPIVREIMDMAVKDGHVLVENIFISDRILPSPVQDIHQWGGIAAQTRLLGDYADKLRRSSSPIPSSYLDVMHKESYALQEGALMMFPGQSAELVALGFQMSTATPTR